MKMCCTIDCTIKGCTRYLLSQYWTNLRTNQQAVQSTVT